MLIFKNSSCQPPCYPSWPGVEYKPINVVTARYSASIYADFKHLKNDEKIPRRCKNICEDYLKQNKNILLCLCRVWRRVWTRTFGDWTWVDIYISYFKPDKMVIWPDIATYHIPARHCRPRARLHYTRAGLDWGPGPTNKTPSLCSHHQSPPRKHWLKGSLCVLTA